MAIPVSLADAKRQLRLEQDDDSQDAEITGFIADAAARVEGYTGHILEARDVEERFDSFDGIELRAWPIQPNASVGIGYLPPNGASTNLYGARVLTSSRPAKLAPALGTRWPQGASSVVTLVRAGYEPSDPVPGEFRRAMLLLIGAYDADREGGDIFEKAEASAKSILRRFRLRRL